MAKTDSTKLMWRVQVRKSPAHKWVNKGLHETRASARWNAALMRGSHWTETMKGGMADWPRHAGYGFGNTRVVRHIRGEKK